MLGVTVGERVIVHLSGFLRHADAYECPAEMTQDGIAVALGISRAHVALELKRLRTAGRVQERMAHVAAAKVRRKVYALTPAGQEIARRMREHARLRTVILSSRDGTREVRGEEALEALRKHGLRESEAVQRILASDRISLAPPEPPKPAPPPGRPSLAEPRSSTSSQPGSRRTRGPWRSLWAWRGSGRAPSWRRPCAGRRGPSS